MNRESCSRRDFLGYAAGTAAGAVSLAAAALLLRPDSLQAQSGQPSQSVAGGVLMTDAAYKPVWRPAKPDATPQLTLHQTEDLERKLACPCGCNLDVYTCRTTDFTCGISPAVHADIQRLVEGGYTADEIMDAMTETYSDTILRMPRRSGFNLLAWFTPYAAVAAGAVGVGYLLRRWRLNSTPSAQGEGKAGLHISYAGRSAPDTAAGTPLDATAEELARLDAALKEEL